MLTTNYSLKNGKIGVLAKSLSKGVLLYFNIYLI